MGAGSSRETNPNTAQHVFAASAPTRYSPAFIENLEQSPQSDSTRSANLELKIQSRLNAELSKINDAESNKLRDLTSSLSATEDKDAAASDSIGGAHFLVDPAGEKAHKSQLSHESVSKEITELRSKLAGRKKLEEADPAVEKARESLVQCLRINDRRPLDCWEEKEAFKREVARLEKKFVDKTLS